jgi:hypothetical protein
MHSLENILLFLFFLLIGVIVYYVSNRKKRKTPFYHTRDKNWENLSPRGGQKINFSVFLIGDAGAPSLNHPEPNFEILKKQLAEARENSAVFFLGDNVYPRGLPPLLHPLREQGEKRLLKQLDMLKNYPGKVCFISGNHDWNRGHAGGLEAVLRQQLYIENHLARQDVYYPRNGCPGPSELILNDEITAIVINTQWWVHNGRKPLGKKNGCTVNSENEFFLELEKLLEKNKNKKLLIIGHHPMYSRAYHGGNFNLKQHLFPLTEVKRHLYVPLPVLGSLYPMYRKYIGSREDMAHPRYKKMRKRLINLFSKYEDLIYAAGHDHNLQYIREHKQHYIVSGAGCKIAYVQHGHGALFTHAHIGFFRLDYYSNGDVWMEVWEPDKKGAGVIAYRKEIHDHDSANEMVSKIYSE